jgi:hypothetical protein
VIGITRQDKVRNGNIRNKLHLGSVHDTLNKFTENCRNHVQGIINYRIPRQMVNYQLQGIETVDDPQDDGKTELEEPQEASAPKK